MLLHRAGNEGVDFLQVFVDLPVCTGKVLQEVVKKLKHLQERRGCEVILGLSCGSQEGGPSWALTSGAGEGISSPCVSLCFCGPLSLSLTH